MTQKILTALLVIVLHGTAMALEEPDYEVIETFDDYEIRRYAPYLVAEVDVAGDFEEAGNAAFRILAGYIFGDNTSAIEMDMTAPVESRRAERGQKMAMTAPVTATAQQESAITIYAFVMESRYSMETLPVPNDKRIRIREMPRRVMAARRYSGRWTEENYQENREILRAALNSANVTIIGEPVLARYNSPFSLPILRRNEVLVKVAYNSQ